MKVYLTPEEVERMAQAATCVRDEVLISGGAAEYQKPWELKSMMAPVDLFYLGQTLRIASN